MQSPPTDSDVRAGTSPEDMHQLASEFENLLKREHDMLTTADAEELRALNQQKKTILDLLIGLQPVYIHWMDSEKESPEVLKLRETLQRCYQQNQDNRILTQVTLSHTNRNLEMIRALQEMNDLYLYESNGELDIRREQRKLGEC